MGPGLPRQMVRARRTAGEMLRVLLSRFALLSFLCIAALALVMGFALSAHLTRAVSDWEWANTAALVRRESEQAGLEAFFTSPVDGEARARWGREFSRLFTTLPEIVRVKVWDRQATVLWSDEAHLIGQRFPDNAELQAALAGRVGVGIKHPQKREHAYERGTFPMLAEVYVPLFSKGTGQVVGVLEIYKVPQRLVATLEGARIIIWAVSLAGGLLLYVILLPLVSQVYGREVQERTLREHADALELVVATRTRELEDKTREIERAYQELSRTQEQLVQSQKMEAVGRLAGGVAHDFNNLLTVVVGRSQLLKHYLGPDSPLRRHVELIEQTADRAAALTRQLLAFSRKQVLQPRVLDLNTIVLGMDGMLRQLIGEDIELSTTLDPQLGAVRADPGQLEQVLLNLAVNARDAMPTGGRLAIATINADIDDAWARQHAGVQAGPHALLTVSDTGVGLDADAQARIFEPFFTTKALGKGTGLGLATVYGIVKQSGGHIAVESAPGRGATFTVYLPRVEGPAESAPSTDAPAESPQGTQTILLVEDEPAVRDVAREVLQLRGYAVLEASHAAEALSISRRHAGRIDLLVTDVVMPQMGGRELAERLALERPDMKILYISGYTDDAIVRHAGEDRGTALLDKPFTPDAFASRVHEVLRRAVSL